MNEYTALVDLPEAKRLMGIDWKPLPVPDALPTFPIHVLPSPCREMVISVSDSLQVDAGMAACFLLGAVSTALLGRVCVRVKRDHVEPIQIQIIVTANPSERKSPVLAEMNAPLREFIKSENTKRKPEIDRQEAKMGMLIRQREQAERSGHESDLMAIIDSIVQAQRNAIRYIELPLTDVTPEALCSFMARNDGCASILSGEGGLFNVLAGAYSSNVNFDIILKGYSGEDVAIERVGRTPIRIEKASLTIALAIQPQLLSQFLSDETMLGRGLCARFLYALPPSMVGKRIVRNAIPVPEIVRIAYRSRMTELAMLQTKCDMQELVLSPSALEMHFTWAQEVENNCAQGGLLDGVAGGWGGKLPGNTARIAGILKMMDEPDTQKPITKDHYEAAVEIARYYMAHTLAATGRDTGLSNEAAEVLEAIRRIGQPAFKPSDIRQKVRKRKRFKHGNVVDAALSELEDCGYIRQGALPLWNSIGRKPEAMYEVHPDLPYRNTGAFEL